MKKIALSTLIMLSMIFISCSRIPFEVKKPIEDASLVYVYAVPAIDTERITKYKISINGKDTKGFIGADEYVTYDLKSMQITMAAIRNDIEKQEVSLNLEAGQSYYLKVRSFSDDFAKFNFTLVDEATALEDLKTTTLAGAYSKEDNIIEALILPKKDTNKALVQKEGAVAGMTAEELDALIDKKVAERSVSPEVVTKANPSVTRTSSKLDDVRKAYEMKKDGLLTDVEFMDMKSEILAK
ncbi:MAG: hypothetical protein ACI9TV_000214 [Sulfurimonas sp.]|jgi:hypothetical protein|uniref:hypothetical protein n=1 Tax=Sulfurimonas sp. TaxID=2022749 RepID=UPI0039E70E2B